MKLFFCVAYIFLAFSANSQDVEKWLFLGKESEQNGEYLEACKHYETGLKINPKNLELNFRYAESLSILNNYLEAEIWYKKTIKADSLNEYPLALQGLANTQKLNGKYKESRDSWELIKTASVLDPSSSTYQKANQEILALNLVLKKEIPSYAASVVNLAGVNTNDAEFAGAYFDNTTMVFSTLPKAADVKGKNKNSRGDYIKIVTALKGASTWEKAILLPEEINERYFQNANGSFSPDKKFFVFTRCPLAGDCGIYISAVDSGKFSEATPLSINVSGFSSTQPHLSLWNDKLVLFFSSNRPDGMGGYDIWYSVAETDFDFGEPINVASINTPEDEITPFFFQKNKQLYFSSTWHPGLGGHDIFYSDTDTSYFYPPENVGKPYNSPANDSYFTLNENGKMGLLTSNRVGSKSSFGLTCCNDIYEFDFQTQGLSAEKKKIREESKNKGGLGSESTEKLYQELVRLLPIQLYFHNDEPNPGSTDAFTDVTYGKSYTSYLSLRQEYLRQNPRYTDALYKSYVTYGYNKLSRFLEILSILMKQGAGIDISIRGFASPLAEEQYNEILTSRRIESFINEVKAFRNNEMQNIFNEAEGNSYIRITKLPLGESKSSKGVSDDYNKKKLSVYSIDAALERRIEIVSADFKPITLIAENNTTESQDDSGQKLPQGQEGLEEQQAKPEPGAEVQLNSSAYNLGRIYSSTNSEKETESAAEPSPEQLDINSKKVVSEVKLDEPESPIVYLSGNIEVDFGKIKKGQITSKDIRFRNTYGQNITFAKVVPDCECTGLKVPDDVLFPEEEITFTIVYDPKRKTGKQEYIIRVITKEISEPIVIRFIVEIR